MKLKTKKTMTEYIQFYVPPATSGGGGPFGPVGSISTLTSDLIYADIASISTISTDFIFSQDAESSLSTLSADYIFATRATISNLSGSIITSSTITNLVLSGGTTEFFSTVNAPTSGQIYDWRANTIFVNTTLGANYTANITNLPTDNNRVYVISFLLIQGGTPYYINALQIGGFGVSILWPSSLAPTPVANRREMETFTILRNSGSWIVLGQYTSFG